MVMPIMSGLQNITGNAARTYANIQSNANESGAMDWLGQQNAGDWLQGFGSILNSYMGYKSYQLGKDQLAFNREAFNFNKDMSVATALAQAQARLSEQQAYGTRQDTGYLTNLINRLQSYGSGNTPQDQQTMQEAQSINETARNAQLLGGWDALERAVPGVDLDSVLAERANNRQALQATTNQNLTANDLEFVAKQQNPDVVRQPVETPVYTGPVSPQDLQKFRSR